MQPPDLRTLCRRREASRVHTALLLAARNPCILPVVEVSIANQSSPTKPAAPPFASLTRESRFGRLIGFCGHANGGICRNSSPDDDALMNMRRGRFVRRIIVIARLSEMHHWFEAEACSVKPPVHSAEPNTGRNEAKFPRRQPRNAPSRRNATVR